MIQHGQSLESVVQGLKDSLELLLSGSSGKLESVSSHAPKETTLRVTSTQPNRAPIEMTVDADFGAYLTVGKGSLFEIPFEGKHDTKHDFVEEISTLISGIMTGGFEEDVLIAKGAVVGASGIIRRGGRLTEDISESWRKIGWHLLSKREREHHTYLPY